MTTKSITQIKGEEFNLSEKKESIIAGSSQGKAIYFEEDVKEFIRRQKDIPLTAKELAEEFHNTYEQFAVNNGWKTQTNCKVNFNNLPEKNKETMIDTCQHILLWIEAILETKRNELAGDKLK